MFNPVWKIHRILLLKIIHLLTFSLLILYTYILISSFMNICVPHPHTEPCNRELPGNTFGICQKDATKNNKYFKGEWKFLVLAK